MSGELIIPERLKPARARRKGSDLATLDEVMNIAGGLAGPTAILVQEMMKKIARLEDRAGITDESIVGEAEPRGTPYDEAGLAAAVPAEVTAGPQFTPTPPSAGGDLD